MSVEEGLVLAKIVSRVRFNRFTQAMLKIGYRNCHIQHTLFVEKWLIGSYFFSRWYCCYMKWYGRGGEGEETSMFKVKNLRS